MAQVTIKGPEGQIEHELTLGRNAAILVGREPCGVKTNGKTREEQPVLAVVASPSVSANHLLIRSSEGTLCVEDLQSRNGTWLLLPRSEPVTLRTEELMLQLAPVTSPASFIDEPHAPKWTGRYDYGPSMIAAIERWQPIRDLDVELRLLRLDEGHTLPTSIPLANGEALDLQPRATAAGDWSRLLEKLWRWVSRQNSIYEAEEQTRCEGMVLASAAIRKAHREVIDAANSEARTLLLTGPSGGGKEMLAEVFHRQTGRSGPFVPVNCSMFTKDLLRAELFGAEVGSFTGATRRIIGAVERAQGGTLFLDEIGDIPEEVQPMLLRFLDRREFETLGQYGKPQRADVCVVAATNKDLRSTARAGRFRVDLWYRLCVHVAEVVSLRERREDILTYLAITRAPGGTRSVHEVLSPSALDVLLSHSWEGNFRELTSFKERLPRDAAVGSIDAATCRRMLQLGSLNEVSSLATNVTSAQTDWAELAARATRAFLEDRGREPASWDDQKEWNEKYLKPLLFFHLSGSAAQPAPSSDEALTALASRSASRVKADRGTALKQLSRFYQRFRD